MGEITGLRVAIAVNKKDVWFCRICIASIRYYYPDVEILLLKDELNGKFSTKEIETKWNVQLVDFSVKKFGWSAAKIFFYTDERFKNDFFLVLDSDIVFIGKLLEKLEMLTRNADVVVSPEAEIDPYAEWVQRIYFDVKKAEQRNEKYKYPGYFFNAGQLLVRGGKFSKDDFASFFNYEQFPYWKDLAVFPLVDQSMLNYLLPVFSETGKIKVNATYKYMLWSEADELKEIQLDAVKKGTRFPLLIHWAGALRVPYLNKMSGSDILLFFENYYYQRICFGSVLRVTRKIRPIGEYYLRIIYKKVKKTGKYIFKSE
ncbi:MAG: hypothetical protein K2X48_05940 [Chitinophagaceae bacterium]|nr:hypothetical protein [Chitinophagaceae bacterium]